MVANYTPITAKVNLQIAILSNNGNQINCPINVNINGKSYTINQGSTIIQIPAGFFNITVNTLQFNNTLQESKGVKYHYVYDNITYNGKAYISASAILFVPPNPSTIPIVYIYYLNNFNYYLVTIEDRLSNDLQNVCPNASTYFIEININSLVFVLNGKVYNYNNSYWVQSGKYNYSTVGFFVPPGFISNYGFSNYGYYYNAYQIYINNQPLTTQYIIVNQPLTIVIYYNYTEQFVQL